MCVLRATTVLRDVCCFGVDLCSCTRFVTLLGRAVRAERSKRRLATRALVASRLAFFSHSRSNASARTRARDRMAASAGSWERRAGCTALVRLRRHVLCRPLYAREIEHQE